MVVLKPYLADDGVTILWIPNDPSNADYLRVLNGELAEMVYDPGSKKHVPKTGEKARAAARLAELAAKFGVKQ